MGARVITKITITKDGVEEKISKRDFAAMPLPTRVSLLLSKALRFYAGTEIVPPHIGMKQVLDAQAELQAKTAGTPSVVQPDQANAPASGARRRSNRRHSDVLALTEPPRLVLIVSSTGGIPIIESIICRLPEEIGFPVVILQHIPPDFESSLAKSLRSHSALPVELAKPGTELKKGKIYVAPGGKNIRLVVAKNQLLVALGAKGKESEPKPSGDVFLSSIPATLASDTVAVILTGMGKDGAEGACRLKGLGGSCIAQNKESCAVYGMPRAVIDGGYADLVCAPREIADEVIRFSNLGS